jgi:hypothetical protein
MAHNQAAVVGEISCLGKADLETKSTLVKRTAFTAYPANDVAGTRRWKVYIRSIDGTKRGIQPARAAEDKCDSSSGSAAASVVGASTPTLRVARDVLRQDRADDLELILGLQNADDDGWIAASPREGTLLALLPHVEVGLARR